MFCSLKTDFPKENAVSADLGSLGGFVMTSRKKNILQILKGYLWEGIRGKVVIPFSPCEPRV